MNPFPAGISVELIKSKTFIEAEKKIINKKDREHITQYFYSKEKEFKIYNIKCGKSFNSNFKLSLDKPEDLKKMEEWSKSRNKNYEEIFPINEKK